MKMEEFLATGTSYCMTWLGAPELYDVPDPEHRGTLLGTVPPFGLYLYTATHTGNVGISLHVGEAPRKLETDNWQPIETVSIELQCPTFAAMDLMGRGISVEKELPLGPGRYFVRAAGRNRVEPPEPLDDPLEQYLIDVWPVTG